MTDSLQELLSELEQFGESNDNRITDRPYRMLNITRDTGKFLSVLARASNAQRMLEIGTSNGYSTLWLADAAHAIGGNVTTVELSEYKYNLAAQNFARSGLSSVINQVHCNAALILADAPDKSFDLIFLDSERPEYSDWWNNLKRVIQPGGLLIVDNAISHSDEMAPFMSLVESDASFTTSLVPVGKGEFLATKSIHS